MNKIELIPISAHKFVSTAATAIRLVGGGHGKTLLAAWPAAGMPLLLPNLWPIAVFQAVALCIGLKRYHSTLD